jgi:hypothetical protein
MTKKQTKYVTARLNGESQRGAARAAGYSENTVHIASRSIEQSVGVQEAFRRALRKAGLTDELLAKRLVSGLNARRTEFFQKDGQVTDKRTVIDYGARRNYAELICKIGRILPADEPVLSSPVEIQIVYVNRDQLCNEQPADHPAHTITITPNEIEKEQSNAALEITPVGPEPIEETNTTPKRAGENNVRLQPRRRQMAW